MVKAEELVSYQCTQCREVYDYEEAAEICCSEDEDDWME